MVSFLFWSFVNTSGQGVKARIMLRICFALWVGLISPSCLVIFWQCVARELFCGVGWSLFSKIWRRFSGRFSAVLVASFSLRVR